MSTCKTTVCNPVKKGGPMGQDFVTYNVQSSFDGGSNSDSVNSPEFTVERRYSDFVLLQKELARAYPGAIIPPLPKDQMFGRFKQDFIDSRMRGLDDFITRIHGHPQLCESPCLRSFLSLAVFDETTIAACQDNHAHKKTWRDDIWKFNPTLVESQSIDTSAMDLKMEEIVTYVNTIKEATEQMANALAKLLKAERDVSHELVSNTEHYASLGVIDDDKVGTALRQVGQAVQTVGSFMEEDVCEKEISVKEPFDAYFSAIKSILKAHATQKEMRSKYLCLVSDLEAKEVAHDKEPNDAKFAKVVQCRNDVDAAKTDFEEVSARLVTDFERLKRERKADMLCIMSSFVTLQVNYNSKVGNCMGELESNMAVLEAWNVESTYGSGRGGNQQTNGMF